MIATDMIDLHGFSVKEAVICFVDKYNELVKSDGANFSRKTRSEFVCSIQEIIKYFFRLFLQL